MLNKNIDVIWSDEMNEKHKSLHPKSSYYSEEELLEIGFKKIGKDLKISRFARFYGVENISIGNNVRIDDFCILSGKIELGSHIHIAAYTSLWGGDIGITIGDYTGISSYCRLYSESNDFSGKGLFPPFPKKFQKATKKGKVIFKKHNMVGTGCILLPCVLEEGVSVLANSLVYGETKAWNIYNGMPAIRVRERYRDVIGLVDEFLKEYNNE